jgi:hypothetical protein
MSRSVESQLKRARELALKERRERKQQKKAARAAARDEQSEPSTPDASEQLPVDAGQTPES